MESKDKTKFNNNKEIRREFQDIFGCFSSGIKINLKFEKNKNNNLLYI